MDEHAFNNASNAWGSCLDCGYRLEDHGDAWNGRWIAGAPEDPIFGPGWSLTRGDHIAALVNGDRVTYAPYDLAPWELG